MTLDVLITISEDTPRDWVARACASVRVAAQRAGYPIAVIEVPGVPGHIGEAMFNGSRMGNGDYIAWVDDDDYVLPDAFRCLAKHFELKPTAICAREVQLFNNGTRQDFPHRHHLTAWRRDIVEGTPLLEHPAYPLVPMFKHVEQTAVDELSWVYVRRIRLSGGMKLRGKHGFGC